MSLRTILTHAAILILCMGVLPAHAAPVAPATSVWATPADAKQGAAVELTALAYNNTAKTVTVSVLFATPATDLATVVLTLPAGQAKTATTTWTVPAAATVVTASILSAVDASQKAVPDMLGPIGTVTVGAASASPLSLGSLHIDTKSWLGTAVGFVEPWRVQQADHFVTLRDQSKAAVTTGSVSELALQLGTQQPDIPGGQATTTTSTPAQRAFPIGTYATLLYSSALATIFASATLFYITFVLLIFLVIRFFFKLFL